MKLRIFGNSLRFRLGQREVADLVTVGRVSERVEFGPGEVLEYSIEVRDAERVSATFDRGHVVVVVPAAIARRFSESDDVGFDAAQGPLKIKVEKDWQCLKPRAGEDESDAYPHPEASKTTC